MYLSHIYMSIHKLIHILYLYWCPLNVSKEGGYGFGQQLPYFRNICSVLCTDNCQTLFAAWTATLAANYLDPPYFLSNYLTLETSTSTFTLPSHPIKALIRSFVRKSEKDTHRYNPIFTLSSRYPLSLPLLCYFYSRFMFYMNLMYPCIIRRVLSNILHEFCY